jgi:exonuclease III
MMQEVNVNSEELSSLVQPCGYRAECNITLDDENTRGTAIVWKDTIDLKNIFTVEECRVQTAQLGPLNIVNVYAPSGQGNKYPRMELYGQTIMRLYRSAYPSIPLMAGDFNCILGAKDARNRRNRKNARL